jgi:hypothetical protein
VALTTALALRHHAGMDRLFGDVDLFHATEHLLPRLKRTDRSSRCTI